MGLIYAEIELINAGDIALARKNFIAQTDIKRLAVWDSKPYENLTISVSEKHAVLVAGDIVEISSSQIYGLSEGVNKTYSHRRGMVLSNRWIPSESRCILSIGIMYPYG